MKQKRSEVGGASLHFAIDFVIKIKVSTSYVNVMYTVNSMCIVMLVRFWHLHTNGMVTRLFFCRTDAAGAASSSAYQKAKLLAEEVRFGSLRRCVGCSSHMGFWVRVVVSSMFIFFTPRGNDPI